MNSSPDPTTSRQPHRPSRWFRLMPALTFLLGLGLGAGLFWVADNDTVPEAGRQEQATGEGGGEPAPAEPSPALSDSANACLELVETAEQVLDVGRGVAAALGELDVERLRTEIERMEHLDPRIRASIEKCREAADPSPDRQ